MKKVISETAAKAKAKALRLALSDMGIVIKHQQALEAVSKVEGQQDWSTLNAKQASHAAPPISGPYPVLNVEGTRTGRFSSKQWNESNVPKAGASEEPIDPALLEYDCDFGVAYSRVAGDVLRVTPFSRIEAALEEITTQNRALAKLSEESRHWWPSGREHLYEIVIRDKEQGWRSMPEAEIKQALAWETRHARRSAPNQGEAPAESEGWFDVNAYKTQERWDGPDLADEVIDGVCRLEDAIELAKSAEFADFYQVTVVAYGSHAVFEPGEGVFTRFDRGAGPATEEPTGTTK